MRAAAGLACANACSAGEACHEANEEEVRVRGEGDAGAEARPAKASGRVVVGGKGVALHVCAVPEAGEEEARAGSRLVSPAPVQPRPRERSATRRARRRLDMASVGEARAREGGRRGSHGAHGRERCAQQVGMAEAPGRGALLRARTRRRRLSG